MSVECLGLADFLLIAEAITGTQVEALARQPGLHRAEHALSAPNAGVGQSEYYPSFADQAAAMAFQLIKGHPLVDGNKRVGYACLLESVYRNGYDWSPPPGDGTERTETVATIEGSRQAPSARTPSPNGSMIDSQGRDTTMKGEITLPFPGGEFPNRRTLSHVS